MYTISLGYVNVPTAGTPVPLSSVITALAASLPSSNWMASYLSVHLKVNKIEFMPKNANQHVAYVGLAGTTNGGANPVYTSTGDFSKSTGVGLLAEVQPSTTSSQAKDKFTLSACSEDNAVRVCDYAVDAGANNEGFVITLFVQ